MPYQSGIFEQKNFIIANVNYLGTRIKASDIVKQYGQSAYNKINKNFENIYSLGTIYRFGSSIFTAIPSGVKTREKIYYVLEEGEEIDSEEATYAERYEFIKEQMEKTIEFLHFLKKVSKEKEIDLIDGHLNEFKRTIRNIPKLPKK
ncbi:hypothetical protein P9112_005195 [Eukaryota sp. TZLM1-RC]